MFDSKGLICKTRKDLSEEKYFAIHESESTLENEISGSDVFIGLSKGNIVSNQC